MRQAIIFWRAQEHQEEVSAAVALHQQLTV